MAVRTELSAVVAGLTGVVVLQLFVSGSWTLLAQTPWLDECLTLLVVNDASFRHAFAAIQGGVENTPPAFHVMLWPIAHLVGSVFRC